MRNKILVALDVDNTIIENSNGKVVYNENLFAALKNQGVAEVVLFTAYVPGTQITRMVGSNTSRFEVIKKLAAIGINVKQVIITGSPYFEQGALKDSSVVENNSFGIFYEKLVKPAEKILNKLKNKIETNKFQQLSMMINSVITTCEKADISKDDPSTFLQIYALLDKINVASTLELEDSIYKFIKAFAKDQKRIIDNQQNKLKYTDDSKYKGGKEHMIRHLIQHSPDNTNILIYDDKLEVNNVVRELGQEAHILSRGISVSSFRVDMYCVEQSIGQLEQPIKLAQQYAGLSVKQAIRIFKPPYRSQSPYFVAAATLIRNFTGLSELDKSVFKIRLKDFFKNQICLYKGLGNIFDNTGDFFAADIANSYKMEEVVSYINTFKRLQDLYEFEGGQKHQLLIGLDCNALKAVKGIPESLTKAVNNTKRYQVCDQIFVEFMAKMSRIHGKFAKGFYWNYSKKAAKMSLALSSLHRNKDAILKSIIKDQTNFNKKTLFDKLLDYKTDAYAGSMREALLYRRITVRNPFNFCFSGKPKLSTASADKVNGWLDENKTQSISIKLL